MLAHPQWFTACLGRAKTTKILASAKSAPCPREHNTAHSLILPCLLCHPDQFFEHKIIKRIQHLWTIHGNRDNTLCPLNEQMLVISSHRRYLSKLLCSSSLHAILSHKPQRISYHLEDQGWAC